MKRSDLINILAEYLSSGGILYETVHVDNITYDILNLIEKAGMLPPYNKNHGIDDYTLAMGVGTRRTYYWEPEDE